MLTITGRHFESDWPSSALFILRCMASPAVERFIHHPMASLVPRVITSTM